MYYQNVRGLRTKCFELYNSILTSEYDIILFTETWLQSDILSTELCDSRYHVFRCDRNLISTGKKSGGGVMLCVRRALGASQCDEWSCAPSTESLCVTIPARALGASVNLHIAIAYVPPDSNEMQNRLNDVTFNLSRCVDCHSLDNFLLVGDFNLPQLRWDSVDRIAHIEGSSVIQNVAISFIDDIGYLGLKQYNFNVNSKGKIFDLCFCTLPLRITSSTNPVLKEDIYHPALHVKINDIYLKSFIERWQPRFNFFKCDYAKINEYLNSINWNNILNIGTVNDAVDLFYEKLNECFSIFVPVSRCSLKQSSYPVWYSTALIKVICEKGRLHRTWKKYGT